MIKKLILMLLALCLVLALSGCGGQAKDSASLETANYSAVDSKVTGEPAEGERAADGVAGQGIQQKIIRTVNLSMIVNDVEKTVMDIENMLKDVNGHVQDANLWQSDGNLQGHLVLRVPVARVDGLLPRLEALGKVERKNIASQDVTEEYYDVDARKNNLQRQEERYLELLDKAGTVKEMLEIESQLARVRGEIESLQARLKVLENRVDLATINVELRAPRSLSTGETIREPFGDRLQSGWQRGVNGALNLVQDLVVLLVILLPYTPLIALAGYIIYRVNKKRRFGRPGGGSGGQKPGA